MATDARRLRTLGIPRRALRERSVVAGLVGIAVIVAIAVVGPWFAPYGPTEIVGPPFQAPDPEALLGTDALGRDVLSRVLWGGRSLLMLALAATVLAYGIGVTIGLVCGLARRIVDETLMRSMDVLLAFPPLLFLLVVATGAGASLVALVVAIAVVQVPGIARIVRSATQELVGRGFVEAARARGETRRAVLGREVLPNISGTILADVGVRLTITILLVASVSFLGLGIQPPDADWALMVSENRAGVTLQYWSVAVPALLIAWLTIAINVLADGFGRTLGVSVDAGRAR